MIKSIILSAAEVRSVLAGTTQIQRPMSRQTSTIDGYTPRKKFWDDLDFDGKTFVDHGGSVFGPGEYLHVPHKDKEMGTVHRVRSRIEMDDVLRCRETWGVTQPLDEARAEHEDLMGDCAVYYRADTVHEDTGIEWRSSSSMPEWASRVSIKILAVTVANPFAWLYTVEPVFDRRFEP